MAGKVINQRIVLIIKVGLGGKDYGLKSATALMLNVVPHLIKTR